MPALYQAPFDLLQLLPTPRTHNSQLPRASTGMTDYTRALPNCLYVSQTMTSSPHVEDRRLTAVIVERAHMKHIGPPVSAHRVLTRSLNTLDQMHNNIRNRRTHRPMLPTLCLLPYSKYPYLTFVWVRRDSVIVELHSSTTLTIPPSLARPTYVNCRRIAWIA
jgi:hypothetical protein